MPRLAALALLLLAACRTPGPAVSEASSNVPKLKVNVFVEPSPALADEVRRVASEVERLSGLATFPTHGYRVHCTLFMSDSPAGVLPEIERRVARVVQGRRAFPLQTSGFETTPQGWLFLGVPMSEPLRDLNQQLAEALADLRDPDQPPPSWLQDPVGLELFRTYGTPGVGAGFHPHFTLLAKGPLEVLARATGSIAPELTRLQGEAVAVGIAIADENGQLQEKRASFVLAP